MGKPALNSSSAHYLAISINIVKPIMNWYMYFYYTGINTVYLPFINHSFQKKIPVIQIHASMEEHVLLKEIVQDELQDIVVNVLLVGTLENIVKQVCVILCWFSKYYFHVLYNPMIFYLKTSKHNCKSSPINWELLLAVSPYTVQQKSSRAKNMIKDLDVGC